MTTQIHYAPKGVLRVRLEGELDHHCAFQVRRELDEAIDWSAPAVLELDMAGVTFMDSSGIGVVLGRYKRIKSQGGSMRVVNVPPRVDQIFSMAGLYAIIARG
ncbi:MAG: anti-sigma factor antagonist [Eubacteriales bacterium]|nr:anti-sigma factor antagonist [Eubacteriales bacterium]